MCLNRLPPILQVTALVMHNDHALSSGTAENCVLYIWSEKIEVMHKITRQQVKKVVISKQDFKFRSFN